MTGQKTEELIRRFSDYEEGVQWIEKQVEQGKLAPVKASGFNGKRPPLYNRYRKVTVKKDYSELRREIDLLIEPPLSTEFYRKHPSQFEQDRPLIVALQNWLNEHPAIPEAVSLNERSFDIFGQEKLLKEKGLRVCQNLNLAAERLGFYETVEPFSSYSIKEEPGPLLVVENLDPFVSIRNLLIQRQPILGEWINTVGYGGGKRIEKMFLDLLRFGSDALKASANTVYYWGDLDYEGIRIFEGFVRKFPELTIVPWKPGYLAMLKKGEEMLQRKSGLPSCKEGQVFTKGEIFFAAFDPDFCQRAKTILQARLYIPQEVLSICDYRSMPFKQPG